MDEQTYIPGISSQQQEQLKSLIPLYEEWNSRINLISRKDIENFEIRHLLFSLSIARIFQFKPGTRIMDAGTGGGLPGIPLAICFPDVSFTLVDSITKKIRVVENICETLHLTNVTPICARFEQLDARFDFVTGRAVTALPELVKLLRPRISSDNSNLFPNGLIYLTGGAIEPDLKKIRGKSTVYPIYEIFPDPFFETKKVVHLYGL